MFLTTFSGCSLIDPHVTWDQAKPHEITNKRSVLAEGMIYADHAKDKYKDAISHQSILTNSLALFLIPLGAAALAMGIDGANATAIAALGLTGAATLGVGSFLSSKPRQLVYSAGIKAIICAKDAMLPLDLENADYATFENNIG